MANDEDPAITRIFSQLQEISSDLRSVREGMKQVEIRESAQNQQISQITVALTDITRRLEEGSRTMSNLKDGLASLEQQKSVMAVDVQYVRNTDQEHSNAIIKLQEKCSSFQTEIGNINTDNATTRRVTTWVGGVVCTIMLAVVSWFGSLVMADHDAITKQITIVEQMKEGQEKQQELLHNIKTRVYGE